VPVLQGVGDYDDWQFEQRIDVLALHPVRADLECRKAAAAARSSALELLAAALAASTATLTLTLDERRGIQGSRSFGNR
jgi:hypothetical protein